MIRGRMPPKKSSKKVPPKTAPPPKKSIAKVRSAACGCALALTVLFGMAVLRLIYSAERRWVAESADWCFGDIVGAGNG